MNDVDTGDTTMMDYDYSDLFVAALVGWMVLRAAEWAFVLWMDRSQRLPRNFPDDHCTDCRVPR